MTTHPRPKILLDCDPGHDDAVAIALAAHYADLVGITTVGGNSGLANTTRNAGRVCALLGIDVPIHAGADDPLVGAAPRRAEAVHGVTGLDGADLPEPRRSPDSHDAVGFIIETVRATEGLWLVPTGPQTNIALAIQRAPDIVSKVGGVSFMGGAAGVGNATSHAEFNIWVDPEAAQAVIGAGFDRVIMAGLDVTEQVRPDALQLNRFRAQGPVGAVFADLLGFYRARCEGIYIDAGAAVHDALAVLALTHPFLFSGRECAVAVETAGDVTRGMTVVDQRRLRQPPVPNVHVLFDVDAEAVFDLITDTFAFYGHSSAASTMS